MLDGHSSLVLIICTVYGYTKCKPMNAPTEQHCTLAAGNCQHAGCQEAKLMHLHLKCCPAGCADFSCPTNHRGCNQARKLLSHYRRCRTIRARQAGRREVSSGGQHNCLVCSLVARQAREVLEQKVSPKSSPTSAPIRKSTAGTLPKPRFAAGNALKSCAKFVACGSTSKTSATAMEMPPPPPRLSSLPLPRIEVSLSGGPLAASPGDDEALELGTVSPPPATQRDRAYSASQAELEAKQAASTPDAASVVQVSGVGLLLRPRSSSVGCDPSSAAAAEPSSSPTFSTDTKHTGSNSSTCDTIVEEASLGSDGSA